MDISLIILLISLAILTTGFYLFFRGKKLLLHGKKTKAFITENNYRKSSNNNSIGSYYPVVKFKISEKQSITQELNVGFMPAKKIGDEFNIIYDPNDPTTFGFDSLFLQIILPILIITIGLVGLTTISLEYLEIIQLFNTN